MARANLAAGVSLVAAWLALAATPALGAAGNADSLTGAADQAIQQSVASVTSLWDQVLGLAARYGFQAAGALVFFVLALWVSRWAATGVQRSLERAKMEVTLARFLAKVARVGVLVLALIACLSILGVEITAFAAVIGASGLAIGLALQGSLSNIAAGAMLAIFRPFKVGDVVVLSGHSGTVNDIDLFQTRLDTFDNRRVIIPNNQVVSGIIENVTHNPTRRVQVDVGVSYDADIDKTRAVLEDALRGVPGRVDDPPSQVMLVGLGASAVDWRAFVWCPRESVPEVQQEAIRAVKRALDAAGLEIPYPQYVVRMNGEGLGDRSGAGLMRVRT